MQPESDPQLPHVPVRFRPFGVRIAVFIFGGLLVLTLLGIGLSFSSATRHSFDATQIITLLGIFGGILAVLYALGRSRIDATDAGLVVVNGYKKRAMEWSEVISLALRPGAPWVVMDLANGTAISAMGIQGSDGKRAKRQFAELRALVEHYSAIPGQD